MDYSQLSDFEINSAVHNAKLKEPYALVFMGDDRIAWTKENGDQIITDKVPYTKNGVHDYCNNPADAWPIIVENKISTMWMTSEKEWCAWAKGDLEEGTWDWGNVPDYYFDCESQLRAAMIVFLQMQDANHA